MKNTLLILSILSILATSCTRETPALQNRKVTVKYEHVANGQQCTTWFSYKPAPDFREKAVITSKSDSLVQVEGVEFEVPEGSVIQYETFLVNATGSTKDDSATVAITTSTGEVFSKKLTFSKSQNTIYEVYKGEVTIK